MNSPAVLWYYKDWIASTQKMKCFTRGAYIQLLAHQVECGYLEDDINELFTIAGCRPDEYEKFIDAWNKELKKKFVKTEKGLVNLKMKKVIEENADRALKNNVNGHLPRIIEKIKIKNKALNAKQKQSLYRNIREIINYDDFVNLDKQQISDTLNQLVNQLVYGTVNQLVDNKANVNVNEKEDLINNIGDTNTTEVPSSNKKEKPHLFSESVFYNNIDKFIAEIGEKWQVYDLHYYYETLKQASKSKGYKYIDWLAACRSWILNDEKANKAVKKKFTSKVVSTPLFTNRDQASKSWGILMNNIRHQITSAEYKLLLSLQPQGFENNNLVLKTEDTHIYQKLEAFKFNDYYKNVFNENPIKFIKE